MCLCCYMELYVYLSSVKQKYITFVPIQCLFVVVVFRRTKYELNLPLACILSLYFLTFHFSIYICLVSSVPHSLLSSLNLPHLTFYLYIFFLQRSLPTHLKYCIVTHRARTEYIRPIRDIKRTHLYIECVFVYDMYLVAWDGSFHCFRLPT